MNALYLLIAALIVFSLGYRFCGYYLSKLFDLKSDQPTPAVEINDGVDFVPAKNWWVLFGHHFSSICGAGPIVGPALACAYWGWGVSFAWLVLGSVWMGAVSDFTSLVMSVKSKGISIAEVAGDEVSKKVRFYFSIFLWISLILVIAVFTIFAAKTFMAEPDAVLPSFSLIPTALLIGWLLYQRKAPNGPVTLLGLLILAVLLFLGTKVEIQMPAFFGLEPASWWILILLVYCFIASVLPVQVLLQPRDYLASFILFAMILIGIAGIVVSQPVMRVPAYNGFNPSEYSAAGPLFPMLFVTIACGAISGFHALVSSGTTCKQIASESHCRRIGYGGMLVESTVGILVLIAVGAGLGSLSLKAALAEGGPITAFSRGFGEISSIFLGDYGKAFAVLALNAFILTTLDTATRITRYITTDVFGIKNVYVATLVVVVASALLALSGKWNLLWPAFGTANQLIAGITLLIASCWLLNRGRKFLITLIPACLMLLVTVSAFSYQCIQAVLRKTAQGEPNPDWFLAALTLVLITIAVSVLLETLKIFKKYPKVNMKSI